MTIIILIVINFPGQYKIIHCKPTNKYSVCNNWYHTLENLNKCINKFSKTFYNMSFIVLMIINLYFICIFKEKFKELNVLGVYNWSSYSHFFKECIVLYKLLAECSRLRPVIFWNFVLMEQKDNKFFSISRKTTLDYRIQVFERKIIWYCRNIIGMIFRFSLSIII